MRLSTPSDSSPDASSPHDTLQSFLINADKVAEEQHQGRFTDAGYRAFRRATVALDLSQVPEELRRDIGEEKALQFKKAFGQSNMI